MKSVWVLPPNYVGIPIVEVSSPHRYRVSYKGQDHMVNVKCDTGDAGLLSGATIDVTAQALD